MACLGSSQVSRREQLSIVDCGEAVRLNPLPVAPGEVINEQELVRAFHAID